MCKSDSMLDLLTAGQGELDVTERGPVEGFQLRSSRACPNLCSPVQREIHQSM